MFLHHIDSTNQSAPTHASNDQADGYATKKKKIGISTWRHKNMRKQRCFEDIEIKNLSGISQQRKKSCNRTRCAGWIRVSLGNVSMNSTGRREKLKKRKREQFWIGFRAVLKPPGESLSRSCYCRQVSGFFFFFLMKPSSSLLSSKVTPPSVT